MQAAAVGQRLAGAAGDDVAGPGQVVDGVDFKDHRAADRRERGPLIPGRPGG